VPHRDLGLLRLLQEIVDQLRDGCETSDIERIVGGAAEAIGFRYFAMIDHDDHRPVWKDGHRVTDPSQEARIFIQNYPAPYCEQYVAGQYHRDDPVVHFCHIIARSFCWFEIGKTLTLSRRQRDFLARGAREGVSDGITVPFQILGERGGSCNFAGPADPERVPSLPGITQTIGAFAFQAARRIGRVGECRELRTAKLTPQERSCVILAGRGQSNKDIAREIGVYPSTVKTYLDRINAKYGVHSRTQAALSAALDGEIGVHEMLPPRFAFLAR